MYTGIQKNQLFESLEAFKAFIRAASIRQRWDLSVIRSNKKNVTLGCRSTPDCPFRVVCRSNRHYTYVTVVNDAHTCRTSSGRAAASISRSEPSRVGFLVGEIPKFFDLNENISPQQVVDAIKRYYGYEIAPRQAHRALSQLQARNLMERLDANTTGSLQPPDPNSGHDIGAANETSGWLQNRGVVDMTVSSNEPLSTTDQTPQIQNVPHQQIPSNMRQLPPAIQQPGINTSSTPHANGRSTIHRSPPRPQKRRLDQVNGGHVVLTDFKIEFTCTSCGAMNQSFFPNNGHITNSVPTSAVEMGGHSQNNGVHQPELPQASRGIR